MSVLLYGQNDGKKWSVDVMPSAFGGYVAVVQVCTTLKITCSYENPDVAKQAGCDLLALTFDELEVYDA